MTDIGLPYAEARAAAREIADQVIQAARNSGSDPIVWVTGNNYMPPIRSFAAAEKIWEVDRTGDVLEFLMEQVDRLLSEASVAMECPDYDNAYYAVDLKRFEYVENPDGETLQDDWRPVIPCCACGFYSCTCGGDPLPPVPGDVPFDSASAGSYWGYDLGGEG